MSATPKRRARSPRVVTEASSCVFATSKQVAWSPRVVTGGGSLCVCRFSTDAPEGVIALSVRVCSWEQTAAKITAAPPASPEETGNATPVGAQPTPLWVDWLKGSCRVEY